MKMTNTTNDSAPTLYDRLGGHDGIMRLIRPFYADIRQHAVLGPIFNARIHDWPAHLSKIAEFWARQTGGPSRYGGGFGAAHLTLGIGPEHFEHWLKLWAFNSQRQLPPPEAGSDDRPGPHVRRASSDTPSPSRLDRVGVGVGRLIVDPAGRAPSRRRLS